MWESQELWRFLPWGYLLTVTIELPVLLVGLSARHSWKTRLIAGFGLTAATYPIVVLVMPLALASSSRTTYLAVAEVFAPLAECGLFRLAIGRDESIHPAKYRRALARDFTAIICANLASFLAGEIVYAAWW